jgi:hypothetical protein
VVLGMADRYAVPRACQFSGSRRGGEQRREYDGSGNHAQLAPLTHLAFIGDLGKRCAVTFYRAFRLCSRGPAADPIALRLKG